MIRIIIENSCLSIDLSPVFGECDLLDHRKKKSILLGVCFLLLYFPASCGPCRWSKSELIILYCPGQLRTQATGVSWTLEEPLLHQPFYLFIIIIVCVWLWLCLESFSGLTCLFVGWTLVRIHLMVSPWHSQTREQVMSYRTFPEMPHSPLEPSWAWRAREEYSPF